MEQFFFYIIDGEGKDDGIFWTEITHDFFLDKFNLDIYNGSTSHLQTPLFLQHPF